MVARRGHGVASAREVVKLVRSPKRRSSHVPFIRIDEGSIPDEMMTDKYRAMMEAFQYLKPKGWGGALDPVCVAVRPADVKEVSSSAGERGIGMDRDAEMETVSAQFAADIAALGAVRAYIRYDGGNDQGFAYLDHCVFKDGSVRDARGLASDLKANGAAAFPDPGTLADDVACQWAARLLGEGFGTGEYQMYGAFWIDLDSGLLTDDPDATSRG